MKTSSCAGHLLLVHEVREALGPQRAVELVLAAGRGSRSASALGARARPSSPGSRPVSGIARAHDRAPSPAAGAAPPRSAPRASPPSASVEQPLRLGQLVAQVHQALAGEDSRSSARRPSPAAATPSESSPATFSRSSTMSRSAVRFPTPGAAWNRFASPAAIARRSSRGAPAREDGDRDLRPDARRQRSGCRKRSRSSSAREAVERERVVAGDEVGVKARRLPDRGDGRSVSAETASR